MAQQTSATQQRGQQVADNAAREYETLVRALDELERALATPAAGDEATWVQRVRHTLAAVAGFLQEHCEASEQEGGLIWEAIVNIGQSDLVTRVRHDHNRLLRDAVRLLGDIDQYGGAQKKLTHRDVRRRAGMLTARLRRHQAHEADLLYEAFDRVVGVLD